MTTRKLPGRKPPSYDEVARLLEALPVVVFERRRALGLSIRAASKEMGFSYTTLARLEEGVDVHGRHLILALKWLDGSYQSGN